MASLPGADKYRRRVDDADAPWLDPLVVKANAEVRVEDVLNTYFGMHVPYDADGWKTYCPFAVEHEDGGVDRQFRIYHTSNTAFCFALHGTMDPVRLWRFRRYFPSLRDTAEDLLKTFGIEYRPKPYRQRMAALREVAPFRADEATVVQALLMYLDSQPSYAACQYDESVLRGVNLVLNEVPAICAQAQDVGEVETWLQAAKGRLDKVLTEPPLPPRRPVRR